ncbi:MAG: hypothetical protein CSA53_00725 [Gammaproteobacteria bacterium]|nr:MAG: hypothetical protein CSA53_00725 [Gammaproteobacteria bacterium]
MKTVDIAIIGGGMVGAAFALAMLRARSDTTLALVETHFPQTPDLSAAPDLRVSALSAGTVLLLQKLGAWDFIEAQRVQPYRRLRVSEHLGSHHVFAKHNTVRFDAESMGYQQLGFMVENAVTQWGLWRALETFVDAGRLRLYSSEALGALADIQQDGEGVTLGFENGGDIVAKLLVGADGGRSSVRRLLQIPAPVKPYQQTVLAVGVELAQPAAQETWQVFKPSGPVALLPLMSVAGKHYAVLICYDGSAANRYRQSLSDARLLDVLRSHYEGHLPDIIRVYGRAGFPLSRMHAQNYYQGKAVLIGDAAHTINPLAGQGVNLGFQDLRVLSRRLAFIDLADSVAVAQALAAYQALRKPENALMMHAMDAFYHGFSNDLPPLRLLRNLGLSAVGKVPWLQQQVLRHAMGL